MICKKCMSENDDNSKFCMVCGEAFLDVNKEENSENEPKPVVSAPENNTNSENVQRYMAQRSNYNKYYRPNQKKKTETKLTDKAFKNIFVSPSKVVIVLFVCGCIWTFSGFIDMFLAMLEYSYKYNFFIFADNISTIALRLMVSVFAVVTVSLKDIKNK